MSLRCHQSRDTDRTLLDDMETVFVLIAFRRFAQFSGNQRKRTDSGVRKIRTAVMAAKKASTANACAGS